MKAAFLFTASLIVVLSGCQSGQIEQVPVSIEPAYFSSVSLDKVFDSAEAVLTEMYFDIEKLDIDSGVIRTRPLSGAQLFQVWRKDNANAYNTLESNLHSLRRTANLDVAMENGQVRVKCQVMIQRLSLPEKKNVTMATAASSHTRSDRSEQSLELNSNQKDDMAWIDLGADPALENEIIKRIEQKLN